MAKLNKVISGVQFVDDFESHILSTAYTLSSSDLTRYSLTDSPGHLRMNHGPNAFLVLMDIPDGDFMIEIKNSYSPILDTDVAGLIVWRTMDDFIQLLEWCDPVQNASITYPYMRLERKGITYTGYGSQEGSDWNLIGAIQFEGAGKVGLVVDGENVEDAVPFDVDYVKIFRNRYLDITNVPEGYVVKLYDEYDALLDVKVVPDTKSGVRLELTNYLYPLRAKLMVFNNLTELVIDTPLMDFYGGDVYYYGDMLEVYMIRNGIEELVQQSVMTELGEMKGGDIEVKFRIRNSSLLPFYNARIKALPYGSIYGYQWVTLCVENLDLTKGEKFRDISFDQVIPGQDRYFYMYVTRDATHMLISTEPYKFTLLVMTD